MKRMTGFTLLEVIVALAVLAIAMGAIINAATQSIASTAYLRDQTMASWVALNQVNQQWLTSEPWPEEGSHQGSTELAGRSWHWQVRFAKTDDPDLRRIEVTVRAAGNGPTLSTLTAFKANPPEKLPPKDPLDPSAPDQPPRKADPKIKTP